MQGAPNVPGTFVWVVYSQIGVGAPLVKFGTLTFEPNPLGWLCHEP